jgi:hypothetical protein
MLVKYKRQFSPRFYATSKRPKVQLCKSSLRNTHAVVLIPMCAKYLLLYKSHGLREDISQSRKSCSHSSLSWNIFLHNCTLLHIYLFCVKPDFSTEKLYLCI